MTKNKEGKNARFGSRYGSKIRKRVSSVESKYKYKKQVCPFCGEKKAKRVSAGIYSCSNCKKEFAGGAYEASTLSRRILNKMFDKAGKARSKHGVSEEEIEEVEEAEQEEI